MERYKSTGMGSLGYLALVGVGQSPAILTELRSQPGWAREGIVEPFAETWDTGHSYEEPEVWQLFLTH